MKGIQCALSFRQTHFLEKSGVFLQKYEHQAGEDLTSTFLKSGKTNEELNAMDCSVVARYVDDLCKSGTLKLWKLRTGLVADTLVGAAQLPKLS